MEKALKQFRGLWLRHGYITAWLALGGLALVMLLRAWVAEDAYITFRVVDNFLNGYGLRWNVHERVQVYTHPLWMLLHIPLAAGTWNIYLASIGLCLICSYATLIVVMRTVPRPPLITIATFIIPLYFSKAFMDYSSSGLENPLSFLMFALFGHVLLNHAASPRFWLYVSLTVAIALFNRLDVAVIYAPILAYLVFARWQDVRWGQVFIGALPLLGWFAFALFYYGFVFPNTKYAKLNTGLGWIPYLNQGFQYFKHLMLTDTASVLLMVSALVFFFLPPQLNNRAPRQYPLLPQAMAAGVYIYFFYVINIGGDYMAGRFWAFPVFVSVWMLHAFLPTHKRPDLAPLVAMVAIAGYLAVGSINSIRQSCGQCLRVQGTIINAINSFANNRLIASFEPLRIRREGEYMFARDGRMMADKWEVLPQPIYFIGMSGYYAGAKAPLLDELGLADPLTARLPAIPGQPFFSAHFKRKLPEGYRHAVQTGSLERMDPLLSMYYAPLRLITTGELLDPERLKTIVLFNFGYYDKWKEAYLANQK